MCKVKVLEGIYREVLSVGDNLMVVRFIFQKGSTVPRHSHLHEQSSYISQGSLKYEIDGIERILNKGDSLVIKANRFHSAIALEDTVDINSFTPIREDYL